MRVCFISYYSYQDQAAAIDPILVAWRTVFSHLAPLSRLFMPEVVLVGNRETKKNDVQTLFYIVLLLY